MIADFFGFGGEGGIAFCYAESPLSEDTIRIAVINFYLPSYVHTYSCVNSY